jgi:outer membrane protein assembly factor BamB
MLAILALTLIAAPEPKVEPADWKPVIKDRTFKFDEAARAWTNSVTAAKESGVTIDFAPEQEEFTFAKKDGPKFTVLGHAASAYVVRGDVLYFPDHHPKSNGCKLIAYDMTTGKKAWTQPLEGIGQVEHTKYRNRVVMSVEAHPTAKGAFALVVTGWESAGAYIEVRDLTTGNLMANKTFKNSELTK